MQAERLADVLEDDGKLENRVLDAHVVKVVLPQLLEAQHVADQRLQHFGVRVRHAIAESERRRAPWQELSALRRSAEASASSLTAGICERSAEAFRTEWQGVRTARGSQSATCAAWRQGRTIVAGGQQEVAQRLLQAEALRRIEVNYKSE